jgi:N-methylhydantoinase A
VALSDIAQVIHGTTLVTNALIQRRGAKTAFITTEGFRDVIEMRSENRFEQYDLNLELPAPLIARSIGSPWRSASPQMAACCLPLDEGETAALACRIADGGMRRSPWV